MPWDGSPGPSRLNVIPRGSPAVSSSGVLLAGTGQEARPTGGILSAPSSVCLLLLPASGRQS